MFGRKKHKAERAPEADALAACLAGGLSWTDAISSETCAHVTLGEFLDAIAPEQAEGILKACALTRTRTLGTLGPRAQAALTLSITDKMPPAPVADYVTDYDLDEPDDLMEDISETPESDEPESDESEPDEPESDEPESDEPEQSEEELS